jgi:CubicO group peptidase (beta-lactamase class C family)
MPPLPIVTPQAAGFDPARLRQADALLERWIETDRVPAAALVAGRNGRCLAPRLFGRQRPERDARPLRPDAMFLVASITKPVTATAVMLLVERGVISLHDRVADYLPDFAQNGKQDIRIVHLLTHTSGLPDMLPDNVRLRRERQPLSAFVAGTCGVAPAFRAGTAVNYQSMGFAILAELVHQAGGRLLPEFLAQEVFAPLGMDDTSLGCPPARRERVAAIRTPPEQGAEWGWNSPYWLGLGVPWGGLLTTSADLARFCVMMLGGGALGTTRILSPAAVRAMTSNQLALMPDVPEVERRARPWGLGWRLNWPGQPATFSDLVSPRTSVTGGGERHLVLARPGFGGVLHSLHHAAAGSRRPHAHPRGEHRGGGGPVGRICPRSHAQDSVASCGPSLS